MGRYYASWRGFGGEVSEPSNVVNMKVQGRLIREAREARAKRKAERDKPEAPQFPGGIDDMEI
jgi:hypothetical protein